MLFDKLFTELTFLQPFSLNSLHTLWIQIYNLLPTEANFREHLLTLFIFMWM